MNKIAKYRELGIFLGMMAWIAGILWGCGSTQNVYLPDSEKVSVAAEAGLQSGSPEGTEGGQGAEKLCVYVCGAVRTPGVYMLPQGSRVVDAMEAAGGMKKDASADYWNLAEPVSDGQMIDVPTQEEAEAVQAAAGGQDGDTQEASNGAGQGASADGRININTASKEQLMQIPGVGETRAENIIRYRESSGEFSSIEDIMNVTGIKEGLFAKMKDYISTSS